MLEVELIAGRLFDENRPRDLQTNPESGASGAIILNELAVTQLGFASPEAAIGQQVFTYNDTVSEIIGVIRNVRLRSVSNPPLPTYYWVGPHEYRNVVLRLERSAIPSTLAAIDDLWREFFPDLPVRRQFMDEAFADYYQTERSQAQLMLLSAAMMAIIAAMGLYGLAALTTERRSREIGIRKVLGATVRDIVKMLVWQFSKPVVLANLIAWPFAWYFIAGWLDGFIYRLDTGAIALVLAGAGVFAFLVAWGTVASRAYRVAQTNPISALRYE